MTRWAEVAEDLGCRLPGAVVVIDVDQCRTLFGHFGVEVADAALLEVRERVAETPGAVVFQAGETYVLAVPDIDVVRLVTDSGCSKTAMSSSLTWSTWADPESPRRRSCSSTSTSPDDRVSRSWRGPATAPRWRGRRS